MLLSIVQDEHLTYPDGTSDFSPSVRYPECPFDDLSTAPNAVYRAVRDCLLQSGLDSTHAGLPSWNPLGAYIKAGNRVFVLCNFVYHRKAGETEEQFFSKCTHGSVVRAILDYVLIAAGPSGHVAFGNAPLQSCDWERVLHDTGADRVRAFYAQRGARVVARDLRLFVAPRAALGRITEAHTRSETDGVDVILGSDSLLEEFYGTSARGTPGEVALRVSDYNPDRTSQFHRAGEHRYVINRAILDSDVILSVPKLKTHEKVGITVGLKGLVGSVGHKDCLAHHRFGPPSINGDEYPESSRVRVLLSRFHDHVYRHRYPAFLRPLFETLDRTARRIVRRIFGRVQAGAWHGNDTAWRMTLDLARITRFADARGAMTETTQRRHLVLIDGVIGGEGNGPLSPRPVAAHTLIFSDNLVAGDAAACQLMGYRAEAIPVLNGALGDPRLREGSGQPYRCVVNGTTRELDSLPPAGGRPFLPPAGWSTVLP
jgi:uncharacterized protein (DUF362 family)